MGYRGKKKSDAEKALATVKVSTRGLSKLPEPQRSWQEQNRRTRKRDSIIYRDWLNAEDKAAEIDLLQERWGFKRRGDVLRIIEKGKFGVIPAMAADVKVLQQVKREEVLREFDSWRSEIDLQLKKLRIMRNAGQKMAEIEVIETAGGKSDGEKKTKKVSINAEIRRLEAEKAKSFTPEAAALADYGTKQADGPSGFERGVAAAGEFVEAFGRLGSMLRKPEPIEVEAEIIQD